MEVQVFRKDDVIVKDGTIPKYFYILKEGEICISKHLDVKNTNYWP